MSYHGFAYFKKSLKTITEFETFGDYLELFNGDYDSTETFVSTTKSNDTREIIDFISFVYDIPKEQIILRIC